MKQKTKHRKGIEDHTLGDSWVFTAIERHSKLILAWHLGHRTAEDTEAFTEKLAHATKDNFQSCLEPKRAYVGVVTLASRVRCGYSNRGGGPSETTTGRTLPISVAVSGILQSSPLLS